MADRTYRSGRDRYDRERFDRDRGGFNRQAEQFDAAGYDWRDDERSYGQMGEGWREEDYGQFQSRERGRDAGYRGGSRGYGASQAESPSRDFAGRGFNKPRFDDGHGHPGYGAGSWLADNHGEWRDYGTTPSRENRDYRGTWGGLGRTSGTHDRNERGLLERAGDTIAHWLGDDADYGRGERGFRGRGPANYTRSDERIRDDANDRLTDDWHVDASRIEVTVENGEITLNGTVPSREQKRRAEDCVEDISGVRHVQNNLRVEDSDWNRTVGSRSNPTSTQA